MTGADVHSIVPAQCLEKMTLVGDGGFRCLCPVPTWSCVLALLALLLAVVCWHCQPSWFRRLPVGQVACVVQLFRMVLVVLVASPLHVHFRIGSRRPFCWALAVSAGWLGEVLSCSAESSGP